MVSPLQSIAANLRPAPDPLMQVGDILSRGRQVNSNLQTQDLQRQAMQQQMAQRQQSMNSEQSLGAARYLNSLGKQLLSVDESQWSQILGPNLPQLQQLGYTPEVLQGMTREQIQGVVAQTEPLMGQSQATASQRDRTSLLKDLKSSDENVRDSAAIALGLQGRATGAAPDVVMIGGVPHMFDRQAGNLKPIEIEGEQVTAETVAVTQAKIKSSVAEAVKNAKNLADSSKVEKSNSKALNVYDTAMSGLVKAMSGTETGLAGWLPAVGANARIAEGAVSAMAPVLKQLFRSAGEGSFTDSDQRLLMEMIPTRRDNLEARTAKIQNIDAIVRAKLGSEAMQGSDQLLREAEAAIAAGADRNAVMQRLQQLQGGR